MSESNKITHHLAFVALQILRDNGGAMPIGDLRDELENRVEIPEAEKKLYRNGRVKWKERLSLRCDNFVIIGFLRRENPIWRLTPKGEKALREGNEATVTAQAWAAYQERDKERRKERSAKK